MAQGQAGACPAALPPSKEDDMNTETTRLSLENAIGSKLAVWVGADVFKIREQAQRPRQIPPRRRRRIRKHVGRRRLNNSPGLVTETGDGLDISTRIYSKTRVSAKESVSSLFCCDEKPERGMRNSFRCFIPISSFAAFDVSSSAKGQSRVRVRMESAPERLETCAVCPCVHQIDRLVNVAHSEMSVSASAAIRLPSSFKVLSGVVLKSS